MAARKVRTKLNDDWRKRIQASMLVNRLTEHVMSDPENPVMSQSQIQAAKILLAKVVPDLKAIEHTGEDGGPLRATVTMRFESARAEADR